MPYVVTDGTSCAYQFPRAQAITHTILYSAYWLHFSPRVSSPEPGTYTKAPYPSARESFLTFAGPKQDISTYRQSLDERKYWWRVSCSSVMKSIITFSGRVGWAEFKSCDVVYAATRVTNERSWALTTRLAKMENEDFSHFTILHSNWRMFTVCVPYIYICIIYTVLSNESAN